MTTELQAEFHRLAGATVPCRCPACVPEGVRPSTTVTCKEGKGRVYLFPDSVRVPCIAEHLAHRLCKRCNSNDGEPSWVANEDEWVWGPVFWEAMAPRRIFTRKRQLSVAWALYSGLDAVVKAMLEVVQAVEGVRLD